MGAFFDGEAGPDARKMERNLVGLADCGCPPRRVRLKDSAFWRGFGLVGGGASFEPQQYGW